MDNVQRKKQRIRCKLTTV